MPAILQSLSEGQPLFEICHSLGVSYAKTAQWICESRERTEQYDQALRIWADRLAQECPAIAKDAEETAVGVAKAALRVNTNLKLAGRLDRARYGATGMKSLADRSPVASTERDELLLETARSVAYILKRAEQKMAAKEPLVIEQKAGQK